MIREALQHHRRGVRLYGRHDYQEASLIGRTEFCGSFAPWPLPIDN